MWYGLYAHVAQVDSASELMTIATQLNVALQDAMAIVRATDKPSLFLTMTTNASWKEILDELLPGQTANDRPDVVARVFNAKLKELRKDLLKGKWFGTAVALIDVVEWQKRGLPHAHLLLILQDADKLRTVDDYDSVVQAFLPECTSILVFLKLWRSS